MQNLNFSFLVTSVTSLVLKSPMWLVCTPLDRASPYTQEEMGVCAHCFLPFYILFYYIKGFIVFSITACYVFVGMTIIYTTSPLMMDT